MHRARPDSKLLMLEGAAHMGAMEQPECFNRALRAFVQSIPRR
jgi:pimeloyl-ACP methyl ester carboxylesterase